MADINVDDITNSGGTGVFDRLMTTINSQIEAQFLEQRITGSEYATVYLGAMQSALSQSIQFAMQEELTEAQIAGIEADNLVKAKQLEIAELEREAKQYEVDNILPEQLTKIQEEIDLLQTQDSEMLLDGVKKRLLMDEELQTADLQQVILQTEEELKTAQKDEILDATTRANTELTDKLATTVKQRILLDEEKESADKQQLLADEQIKSTYAERVLKDKQAAKLGLDNVMRTSEAARDSDPSFVYTPNYEE